MPVLHGVVFAETERPIKARQWGVNGRYGPWGALSTGALISMFSDAPKGIIVKHGRLFLDIAPKDIPDVRRWFRDATRAPGAGDGR